MAADPGPAPGLSAEAKRLDAALDLIEARLTDVADPDAASTLLAQPIRAFAAAAKEAPDG
jgi:hypothetical protein